VRANARGDDHVVGISVRKAMVVAVLVLVAACAGVVLSLARAGDEALHCERSAAESVARARIVTGHGARVVVIGDSYSAGWGLADPARSWPSSLSGEVHVDGFSGSGFSDGASSCGSAAYADRAAVASGADLVVVQGGLNDTDQPADDVRSGVRRLLGALRGYDVLLVGPPSAPSRAAAAARVDVLLASEAGQAGIAYLSTLDLDLEYLDDDLHLSEAGHRAFGRAVARALAAD
jgi:acyl-CoA thioesterase-1